MRSDRFGMKPVAAAVLLATLAVAGQAQAQATFVINNINAAGVGYNDLTPRDPVGGNTGTTLGAQRLLVLQTALNIWGATLSSNVVIRVNSQFAGQTCTAGSAVLASAGTTQVFANFLNAPQPGTWYPYALANKLAGSDLATTPGGPQINTTFNINLGQPNCLPGPGYYYGLDNNEPTGGIDMLAVAIHELGHGIGFQNFTNGQTGAFFGTTPLPSIWDHFLFSVAANGVWKDITAAQRAASAVSGNGLVWTGLNVNSAAPGVLRAGQPSLVVSGPTAGPAAGTYTVGEASFGAPLSRTPVVGTVAQVSAQADDGGGNGCAAFDDRNIRMVSGRIALIDRGVCGFVVKVKNAQNAGAIGVLIADNAAGAVTGLGGADPTITIPAVRITQADGNTIKSRLQFRSRRESGVIASLSIFGTQLSGADPLGRLLMNAPSTFAGGSSVSHFDPSATPNLIMEPAVNGDLISSVVPPRDLTMPLFRDIGW